MNRIRRMLLSAGLVSVASQVLARENHTQLISERATGPNDAIDLWPPGRLPRGDALRGPEHVSEKGAVTNVSHPRLNVYLPKRPNGTAMVVMAGGGYTHIELGTESTPACRWLQSLGIVAFELVYRLPGEGWTPTAPLQDGQRAMRVVRATASSYGVDPHRIGVLGFSAGGHLAGMTAATPSIARYPAVDQIDAIPSKPDFAGLIYPVLSLMPPFDQTHTRHMLVGEHPSAQQSATLSVDRQVSAAFCPTFLAQAADDPISPIDNSLLMFNALREHHIASELHVFQAGGHGWGMGQLGSEVHQWSALFATWLTFNHLL